MQGREKFLRYALDVGHDQQLQVISDPDNVLGQHIGNGVWTSAHELVYFLRIQHPSVLRHQSVLELGAGLGLAGQVCRLTESALRKSANDESLSHSANGLLYAQAAALSGANVVLSDMAEMMQLMQINTEANEKILLDCPGTTVLPVTFPHAYLLPFSGCQTRSYRPDSCIYVLCHAKALAVVNTIAASCCV